MSLKLKGPKGKKLMRRVTLTCLQKPAMKVKLNRIFLSLIVKKYRKNSGEG